MEHQLPNTSRAFIESLIPQKAPFVMVQELLQYDENSLTSALTIQPENIFTSEGTFQAAGLLEHQAQSVALHTGYQFLLKGEPAPTGYIGAVKNFQISTLPKTGERIMSKVEILNEMMGVTLVKIQTELNGQTIATSEMKTVLK